MSRLARPALQRALRLCQALAVRLEIAAATADADWRSVAGGPQLILLSRQRR